MGSRSSRVKRVLAGLEGRAFDLGDDRRASADRRTCLDHAGVEDRIDDRSMAERFADADLAAVVEDRQPGRRSGAARRAIDLAVGEDRDVALGQRLVADGFPEDHAVDATQIGLVWVDDVDRLFQGRPELTLQGDQLGERCRLDVEAEGMHVEGAVERAAEPDVERERAAGRLDDDIAGQHERGHVAEADGLDPTGVIEAGRAGQPARGDVDRQRDLVRARLDREAAGIDRPGHERDGPVATGRRVALVVEEHDAEVAGRVVGRRDEAAVHVGVAARLVDEELADVVEVRGRPATPFRHRAAFERGHAAGHDPEGLAARVVVGRRDLGQRASSASRRALTPGHSPARTL